MNKIMRLAVAAALALTMTAPAFAANETYSGSLMCAMCMLKKADAHECQDVLVVTAADGAKVEYYVTQNDVAKAAGEACTNEIKASVTGTVSEKDGKKWITPSKIEKN